MFYLEHHNTVSDVVLTAEEAHTTGYVSKTQYKQQEYTHCTAGEVKAYF